jgi:hypothetical protein
VLKQFTPQSKEKTLVNDLAAAQLTVPGETVAKPEVKKEITAKQAGTTAFGLLLVVVALGSLRSSAQ